MKTNFAEISRLYQEHLRSNGRGAIDSCPDPEHLIKSVTGRVSRKEKAEIIRHVGNCIECARVLKATLNISAETDQFVSQVDVISEHGSDYHENHNRGLWNWVIRRPIVATLISMIVVAVFAFSIFRLLDKPGTRGGPGSKVQLISPAKASLQGDNISFKWEGLTNVDNYVVELFDKSINLVWRSGPLHGNEARLPDKVGKDMISGETYYWSVTAVMNDQIEIRSPLAEFSVKK